MSTHERIVNLHRIYEREVPVWYPGDTEEELQSLLHVARLRIKRKLQTLELLINISVSKLNLPELYRRDYADVILNMLETGTFFQDDISRIMADFFNSRVNNASFFSEGSGRRTIPSSAIKPQVLPPPPPPPPNMHPSRIFNLRPRVERECIKPKAETSNAIPVHGTTGCPGPAVFSNMNSAPSRGPQPQPVPSTSNDHAIQTLAELFPNLKSLVGSEFIAKMDKALSANKAGNAVSILDLFSQQQ